MEVSNMTNFIWKYESQELEGLLQAMLIIRKIEYRTFLKSVAYNENDTLISCLTSKVASQKRYFLSFWIWSLLFHMTSE